MDLGYNVQEVLVVNVLTILEIALQVQRDIIDRYYLKERNHRYLIITTILYSMSSSFLELLYLERTAEL